MCMYLIVHTYMYIDDYGVHTDTNIQKMLYNKQTYELITTGPFQGRGNPTSTVILGVDMGNEYINMA